ncbi:tetratricopeptide repeat protein 24-like [Pseudophryne corroboree]|uniref:tetratricopeptide repeat protein 24-like n=1 Tax=Pseudophryne corroboree TaxID=495146 RepID=UPI003081460A
MATFDVSSSPNSPKCQKAVHDKIKSLCKEGSDLLNKEDISGALKTFKKAFILSCKLSDERIQRSCLFNLGAVYICVGKPHKALKCLVKSRTTGMEDRDGDLYFNIAAAYDEMQEYGKALKFYERAINEYSYTEINSIADALIKLGYCFVTVGDLSSAAHSFRLAGHSYLKSQKLEDATMAMREAAKYMISSQTFSKTEVLQTLNSCVESLKGVSDKQLLGTLYNHIGLHYAEMKCFSEAEKCFMESMNLCSGKQFSIRKMAVLLQNLGAVDNALYQYEKSLRSHAEAADMYGSLGDRNAQGQCLCNLAFAYSQLRNYDMAEFYYQQALHAFVDAGDLLRQCHVSEGLGATYFCLGNLDHAIQFYKNSLNLYGKSKETTDAPRERILGKLTDVIEYKVIQQHNAALNENISSTRPDQSPSNYVNDACKSITSQCHESCLSSDITATDSSDNDEEPRHRLRGHLLDSKLKHFKTWENDISENDDTHQHGRQAKASISECNKRPTEDEDQFKHKNTDLLTPFKSAEIDTKDTSKNMETSKEESRVERNISKPKTSGSNDQKGQSITDNKNKSKQEEDHQQDYHLDHIQEEHKQFKMTSRVCTVS